MHQTKTPADDARSSKQSANAFGGSTRRDVKVFWIATEQQIADRTADYICVISLGL
jgi:hypothetical protein